MKTIISILGCLIMMAGNSLAATIRIPADYPSINTAMEAASDGDEIVISPGTYGSGGITKRVTLRSTFDGKDWSIIENTRIMSSIGIANGFSGIVIRGLRIGPDPISSPPVPINVIGIRSDGANANIEYCIIENCVNLAGSGNPPRSGGAIKGITGVIQNNILRNNRADGGSAMDACGGIIRNNLIYSTNGYEVEVETPGATQFINNTVYSNGSVGVGLSLSAINANNIYWQLGSGSAYAGLNPHNCVIKGYTGSAKDIITADPKFVDPTKGDFNLQANSPCIDAGITTGTVKADIIGVQRGLKASSIVKGDGSAVDIGAYEYKPKPVSVWLPNGGPDSVSAGDDLKVAWEMELPTAGTAILLQLFNGPLKVADLGAFWNAAGADESTVKLPRNIQARSTYTIRGVSSWNQTLYSNTPNISIASTFTAVPRPFWAKYM